MERLKISWEKVVCCGDSYNDINMIRHAGLGVAMANAPEEIQAMAGYITTADNDHDGIAEVIEKFFLSGGSGSVRERLFEGWFNIFEPAGPRAGRFASSKD